MMKRKVWIGMFVLGIISLIVGYVFNLDILLGWGIGSVATLLFVKVLKGEQK